MVAPRASRGLWRDAFGRLLRNRPAMLGLFFIILFVLGAILAPVLAPGGPFATYSGVSLKPPSPEHIFGTDRLARDEFARALYGAPVSLYTGCNTFVVRAPPGTSWRDIVARMATPNSVLGIWRYDNSSQRYEGVYFSNSEAPTNGATSTIAFTFAIWTCVNANGSVS